MLSELLPRAYSFNFGEARLSLRYDMRALLTLERAGLDYSEVFSDTADGGRVLAFFTAGLREDIGSERARDIMRAAGPGDIWRHCRQAVLLALPEPDPLLLPDTSTKKSGGNEYLRLRALICDVMGKPEEFFWGSTLRELLSRWQEYAIAKGYMKPPERVQMYDEEGM